MTQLNSKKQTILFFSRGRGYGHAIPDMEIARELRALSSDVEIMFSSYGTGFKALAQEKVIDMDLPENNPFLGTLYKADKIIKQTSPDIIVAHEEFAALAAAKLNNIPSIYLSAWMPPSGSVAAESVTDATCSIIIDSPGIFAEPVGTGSKVFYTGSIFRKMQFTVNDRARLRHELALHDNDMVVVVIPGGWATEGQSPLWDTVMDAFQRLPQKEKYLFWIGDNNSEVLAEKAKNWPSVKVLPFINPIERYLAISNVVITKGTRGITLDAQSVGVPSISLSFESNPIDDTLVPRIRNNTALNARATNGKVLKDYIEKALHEHNPEPPIRSTTNAATLAAQHILNILNGCHE